jgi:hypothetical protein
MATILAGSGQRQSQQSHGENACATRRMNVPDRIAHNEALGFFNPEATLTLDEQVRFGFGILGRTAIDNHGGVSDIQRPQRTFDLGAFAGGRNAMRHS